MVIGKAVKVGLKGVEDMKKIIIKVYSIFLSIRWKTGAGNWLLVGSFINDYISKKKSYFNIYRIHRKGFNVTDWCAMNLEENDYRKYVSSVGYYAMHPLNGGYSKWIDDKLTLKYLCFGTELDEYFPKYYYQIDNNGNILRLMDIEKKESVADINEIIMLLKNTGSLAIKMIAGSIGEGFYCAEYREGKYFLNGKFLSIAEFKKKIGSLRNYIIIEYLNPHSDLAKYSSGTVNCLRYLVGRINGDLKLIKSFIRFGTIASGFVENYGVGGVLCYVDDYGKFQNGNILKNGENNIIYNHPDNNLLLKGRIPQWNKIKEIVDLFDKIFPQLNYLGFDFVITHDNKVKILEINSLTSLDAIQLDKSLLEIPEKEFFEIRCR